MKHKERYHLFKEIRYFSMLWETVLPNIRDSHICSLFKYDQAAGHIYILREDSPHNELFIYFWKIFF